MHSVKRRIACFCEKTFDADIPDSADLAAEPEVGRLIASGDFMAVTCPSCGKRLTPEFPFHLTLPGGVGDVLLVPEADRGAYVRGSLPYQVGSPYRVVVGFPELAEKLQVLGSGRDDRVIEIMKYYLLTGAAGSESEEDDRDVTLRYKGEEGGKHVFHVVGMKEGEIGVARLASEIYGKIAADVDARVQEEPFRDFCSPPWVSIRRLTGGEP
ncbi:MAG TPA: CpXC domain-containing protein [Spirochaetia bacterium]|nr:CpXC domain-containing protein [Spirochaetia bacterium]